MGTNRESGITVKSEDITLYYSSQKQVIGSESRVKLERVTNELQHIFFQIISNLPFLMPN